MKRKIWTSAQLTTMPKRSWDAFRLAVEARAWRLLGIPYEREVRWYWDHLDSFVVEWDWSAS